MNEQIEPRSNAFLPIVLIAASLLVFLGRDLAITRQQKTELKQVVEQQAPALAQSREVGAKFEKMVRDLLQLAQTDEEARAIVAKYGISVNTAPAR